MEARILNLIENMYIDNNEAEELINADLSMMKDTQSDAVVICYSDEIYVSKNGDCFVLIDDYHQVYFEKFGEALVTDKIEDSDWKLLVSLFGDNDEYANNISTYQHVIDVMRTI